MMSRFGPVTVHQVATPSLGDRSYLLDDGAVAVVIDPQRDIDRMLAIADARGVRIAYVLETHIHNDYVSGGLALATATGARYVVNADDDVDFERYSVRDGDRIDVSTTIRLRVMATPGHTDTHLSYLLENDGHSVAVFSGGSLLFGSTGRPDLLGASSTTPLARAQWRSARRLAAEAPDAAALLPTHGFGSFCAAQPAEQVTESTMRREKLVNPALLLDQNTYVTTTIAGLDAYPAYYEMMRPANLAGADLWDPTPPARATAPELRSLLGAGTQLIDVRTRKDFAAGYLAGSWNVGIDGPMASYLGWLLPRAAGSTTDPTAPRIALLGTDENETRSAQRELARIGFAPPVARATGDPASWSETPLAVLPRATFKDLATALIHRPVIVIDVRRRSEWTAGHLDVAANISLHELPAHLPVLARARDAEIWVHCAAGYRASTAASMLANAGCRVVAIDDAFACATVAGLSIARPASLDLRDVGQLGAQRT
jgi:hydroxyacylglutathione hydrolase